jgi:hypothetical protein
MTILFCLPAYAQEFLGSWVCESDWGDGELITDTFTFYSDGTGAWAMYGVIQDTFFYEYDQNTITMRWDMEGSVTVYNYSLNEDLSMTLGIDFGDGYQEWVYYPAD